jgi:hypothetical protein
MNAQEGGQQNSYPALCNNGCGFFSTIDSKGYCSVCYKDVLKKDTEAATAPNQPDEVLPATTALSQLSVDDDDGVQGAAASQLEEREPRLEAPAAEAAAVVTVEEIDEPKQEAKKKKNRCLTCKKKTGLTGFTCRCGGLFCGLHRYSDKHECSFDYKALGEEEIAKNNPLIVAQKVAKI